MLRNVQQNQTRLRPTLRQCPAVLVPLRWVSTGAGEGQNHPSVDLDVLSTRLGVFARSGVFAEDRAQA